MGPMLIFALVGLIVTARLCPDTKLGRLLLDLFINGPAQALAQPRWRTALPYLVIAVVLALMVVATPEFAPLAAGLDLSLWADLVVAASVLLVQLNLRRLRYTGRRITHLTIKAIGAIRRVRSRQRRTVLQRQPLSTDDDAPEFIPGRVWA